MWIQDYLYTRDTLSKWLLGCSSEEMQHTSKSCQGHQAIIPLGDFSPARVLGDRGDGGQGGVSRDATIETLTSHLISLDLNIPT